MNVPSDISVKHRRPKLTKLKGEIDYSTITVGNFNTSLSTTERTGPKSKQTKNSQDAEDLSNTINKDSAQLVGKFLFLIWKSNVSSSVMKTVRQAE